MNEAQSNESIAVRNIENAFRRIESQVLPPQAVLLHGHPVLRYVEKTIQQALVAKLARHISMLNAASILMEHGHVHEQGILQRTMDEASSDISFLSIGLVKNDFTERHAQLLEEFWKEEFDAPNALDSSQDRAQPRRDKIRSYVAKYSGPDPSTAIKAERSVYKSYSGYVHGAAPHIMDLHSVACEGFSVRGVAGTYRQDEHRADLRNYYFRTLQATAMVAKAVGDGALCTRMMDSAHEYAKAVGLPL
jgi:hypothetical protein